MCYSRSPYPYHSTHYFGIHLLILSDRYVPNNERLRGFEQCLGEHKVSVHGVFHHLRRTWHHGLLGSHLVVEVDVPPVFSVPGRKEPNVALMCCHPLKWVELCYYHLQSNCQRKYNDKANTPPKHFGQLFNFCNFIKLFIHEVKKTSNFWVSGLYIINNNYNGDFYVYQGISL